MKKVRWKACAIMPAVAMCGMAGIASAAELRIQTHYASESPAGKLVAQFVDDVETMSGGELAIQMHYSSEVVAASQTFGATTQGILDCDMTGPRTTPGKIRRFSSSATSWAAMKRRIRCCRGSTTAAGAN